MAGDGARALYLCNPNNPTGRLESRSRILELAEELEVRGTLLFLDECLLELVKGCEDHSCVKEVDSHPNLFIINSLTKSFGFPGIRIGYGIGSPELIQMMERGRLSWNLGAIEQCIGQCCFEDRYDHVIEAREMIDGEKRRMTNELRGLGLTSIEVPDSFFFFISLCDVGMNSSEFKDHMLQRGVMVRDCTSFGIDCHDHTRFSVRTRDKNDLFLLALERVLER
jgi:threonine-phosphate decarboxylase